MTDDLVPQIDPAARSRNRAVGLAEAIEETGQKIGADSDPRIADLNLRMGNWALPGLFFCAMSPIAPTPSPTTADSSATQPENWQLHNKFSSSDRMDFCCFAETSKTSIQRFPFLYLSTLLSLTGFRFGELLRNPIS